MEAEELDCVLIADLADIRYFCGFTGSNGLLAVERGKCALYTDSRYTLQATSQARGVRVVTTMDLDKSAASEILATNASRVGLSASQVTHRRWERVKRLLGSALLTDCDTLATSLRIVKDERELAVMGEASRLAEEAFFAALKLVVPGGTEREAALAFHIEALRLGADGLSFETIVAAGERGALPHAKPSSRAFAEGDLVVFDFGILLDGYASDQTMTIPVGKVSEEARAVYEVTRKAQEKALAAVMPGVALSEVDRAAREVIARAGYGEYFGHGTGHGVGLNVHEAPTVSPKSKDVALMGMVFTIEPGIYLPGRFGARLEDTIVVIENGHRTLTRLDKTFGAYQA